MPTATVRPATDRQLVFLNTLRVERGLAPIDRADWVGVDTRTASRQIDQTKALPRTAKAPAGRPAGQPTAALTPGVYRLDGDVYIVKPTRDKQRLYAKKLVELRDAQGDRLAEDGAHVRVEFEYVRGAIGRIRPGHRLSVEEGKALTLRYGKCICCGRRLRVAESVERGIGPVCIKYFA